MTGSRLLATKSRNAGVAQMARDTHAAPKEHRDRQEQELVKREIESTDKAIDKLVYELYGLTDDEIKIVEEK